MLYFYGLKTVGDKHIFSPLYVRFYIKFTAIHNNYVSGKNFKHILSRVAIKCVYILQFWFNLFFLFTFLSIQIIYSLLIYRLKMELASILFL